MSNCTLSKRPIYTVCTLVLILKLIIILISCYFKDNSPVPETVSGSQEEHAFLPCFNSSVMDPKTCYRVKWTKQETDSGQMKVILTWPTTNLKDANRVKLEADENSKMSLVLNNLQKSDEGLYTCEIWKGWECILAKNISLKVKGNISHFSLLILAPLQMNPT